MIHSIHPLFELVVLVSKRVKIIKLETMKRMCIFLLILRASNFLIKAQEGKSNCHTAQLTLT